MKSFKEALRKRVQLEKFESSDFYTIKKALEEVVFENYGKIGKENLEVEKASQDGAVIKLAALSSVFLTEARINQKKIIQQVNKKLGGNFLKKLIIFRK